MRDARVQTGYESTTHLIVPTECNAKNCVPAMMETWVFARSVIETMTLNWKICE